MKVCKFGGSSLASAENFEHVCGIVKADDKRRIIVVSAPGKRDAKDVKVTDLLIICGEARLAQLGTEEALGNVMARFRSIQQGLGLEADIIDEIEADLRARLDSDMSDPELFTDLIKAAGEDNTAKLMARALCKAGVDAEYVDPREAGMLLSEEFGNAQVLDESYAQLARLASHEKVVVFPGFFGYTPSGHIATFPRGGSDITGAILAAAVGADIYENFTDVDSVYAAHPGIVKHPRAISEMTYREMRELSYAGFSVLHDEAIRPAVRAGIPVCVKNTQRPEAPGTMILKQRSYAPGEAVGIASNTGFTAIYVAKYLMNRTLGFMRRLLQIFEDEKISIEHVPTGIDDCSVIVRNKYFPPALEQRVVAQIETLLEPDSVQVEHGLALVMIVGEGMDHAVGAAARATHALSEAGVNIEMINQGSSEISMMFGVKAEDHEKAVRAIHEAFFRDEN